MGVRHAIRTIERRTGMHLIWLREAIRREKPRQSKVGLSSSIHVSTQWLTSVLSVAIMHSIQRDWNFMTDAECVPVQVALSLMDTSTLGKADREDDFLRMYNDIQKTLKTIVNGKYPLLRLEWAISDAPGRRTSPGIQQFYRNVSQNSVQYIVLASSSSQSEECIGSS